MSKRVLATLSVIPLLALAVLAARAARQSDGARIRKRIAESSQIDAGFSLGGNRRWIVYNTEYGKPGIYRVSALAPGAPERFEVPQQWPKATNLSPNGRWVVYRSLDFDARVTGALYLLDLTTGKSRTLLEPDGPETGAIETAWSLDGRRLAYVWTVADRAGKLSFELHTLDVESGVDRRLVAGAGLAIHAPAWSPDQRSIAFISPPDVWRVDAGSGKLEKLSEYPAGTPVDVAPSAFAPDPPAWSPDGRTIATTMMQGDCYHIVLLDVASRKFRLLAPGECAMRPVFYPDGDRLAYLRLDHSIRTLWSRPFAGGTAQRLGFADGIIYHYDFNANGDLLLVGQPSDAPRGLWRIDPSGMMQPHLLSMDPPLDERWISKPELTHVKSSDGLDIPLTIFPRTCGAPHRPGPALVWVHDGPANDVAPRWYQEIQYLAASGVTVIAVNFRGSSGNGKAFRDLGDDRQGQIDDVLAAIRYTRGRSDVDAKAVFVFMVCWSTSFVYDALDRLSDPVRGVIDWHGGTRGWKRSSQRKTSSSLWWAAGTLEGAVGVRRELAQQLIAAGYDLTYREYPYGHGPFLAADRARSLEDLGEFIAKATGRRCE